MKQYEAVIKVMEENGGFATLGYLYQEVLKIPRVEWKTKTPFASIRRIVQDRRFFFKIKPGLWALLSYKTKLPVEIFPDKDVSEKDKRIFDHTYYQGLLVEIGNIKGYEVFIPNQDKNKIFIGKTLKEVVTQKDFYQFGYENIVRKAKTIDVSWFNERKMPSDFFEVEYSTNIQDSLLKFLELQDYNVNFFIVADQHRNNEFHDKLNLSAFLSIKRRVKFLDFNKVSEWHTKAYELISLEKNFII